MLQASNLIPETQCIATYEQRVFSLAKQKQVSTASNMTRYVDIKKTTPTRTFC